MLGQIHEIIGKLRAGKLDSSLTALYSARALDEQKLRYLRLLEKLIKVDPSACGMIVSAPGRTELGGNHTDHNNGNVLAAAVDLDCVAAVLPADTPEISLVSEEYAEPIRIDLEDLEPKKDEAGKPEALVRGMAASFYRETGIKKGFYGQLSATCRPGTGLSSSAAFSVLIGGILNFLYAGRKLSAEKIAHMAQEAENRFFGKPCGLMDQMSSSIGGTLAIDFHNPDKPVVTVLNIPDSASGYSLLVIDTGGSHVELTEEYSAIPKEMQAAARALGNEVGRGIKLNTVFKNLPDLRGEVGDRAVLRLLHFIEENDRAIAQAKALRSGNFSKYLELVKMSGESSAMLLQNCSSVGSSREQGILLALALTRILSPGAVARVHGGGFAGTVQAYVPEREMELYTREMERVFGSGSIIPLLIGRPGVTGISLDGLLHTPCECRA